MRCLDEFFEVPAFAVLSAGQSVLLFQLSKGSGIASVVAGYTLLNCGLDTSI